MNKNCSLRVRDNAIIEIGENCFFNNGCIVICRKNIKIGNNCSFGPNVMIFDHDHDMNSDDYRKNFICKEIRIGSNVWIGANTIILKGTSIGDNCVIAAGSIVMGQIEDNSIYYNRREIVKKKCNEKN